MPTRRNRSWSRLPLRRSTARTAATRTTDSRDDRSSAGRATAIAAHGRPPHSVVASEAVERSTVAIEDKGEQRGRRVRRLDRPGRAAIGRMREADPERAMVERVDGDRDRELALARPAQRRPGLAAVVAAIQAGLPGAAAGVRQAIDRVRAGGRDRDCLRLEVAPRPERAPRDAAVAAAEASLVVAAGE